MIPDLTQPAGWLPVVFMALMGLAMLAYVVLDGYDLGVGILLRRASDENKDVMISSIGPFWDANETWLVLGVGILLVAFPLAHGVILTHLYLPVALMLIGLILRGVAFDFRVKARAAQKPAWNNMFYIGSLLATLSQGGMLGFYIVGFEWRWESLVFALFTAFALASGYALLGATWLIMKTAGELQRQAVHWARRSVWLTAGGVGAISVVTPMVSAQIYDKWFTLPNFLLLLPIPVMTLVLFVAIERSRAHLPDRADRWCWIPFACTVAIFVLAFNGVAYSLFPYLVVNSLTIWDAASAPESLMIMLVGVAVVLPMIIGYTIYAYRVFWGKARALSYY